MENSEIDLAAGLKKCPRKQVRDKSTGRCRTDYRKSRRGSGQARRSRYTTRMKRLGVNVLPRVQGRRSFCSQLRKRSCEKDPFCTYVRGSRGKKGSCRTNPRTGSEGSVNKRIQNLFAGGETE